MLQALLTIDPRILATSVAMLTIALGLLVRRRAMLARIRKKRLAEQAEQSGDGETSVLPLAHLASAVEVLDLDDLLAGEEGPVIAAARRQLEAPTDVNISPDTLFPLPQAPVTRPVAPTVPQMASVAAAVPQVAVAATVPRMASVPRPAVGLPDRTRKAAPKMADAATPTTERPVPVRELALAWFEARGYRPSSASVAVRPIELVLRHRKDPARAYAFIVERERVTSERVEKLVEHARSIGLTRVLVAAEGGSEPGAGQRFRRQGVRLVDQDEMRREFDKLDLRIAAKIIAVARSRARLRQSASQN
jgi:hypothetical protein